MPMDVGVTSTWGRFWGDLYTKLDGLDGFAVIDDSGNLGDNNEFTANDQWWVCELPSGENVRFKIDYDGGGVIAQYGPEWDATNDTWTDRYPNGPARNFSGRYDLLMPVADDYTITYGDDVEYTLKYGSNVGFVFYVRALSNGADNSACAFGLAELDRIWDYAVGEEAAYSYLYQSGYRNSSSGNRRFDILAGGGNKMDSRTIVPTCRVHGKSDLTSVPLAYPNVVASGKYGGTLTGVHDFWIHAGEGFANGDVIEDESGAGRYQVFCDDAHGTNQNNPIESVGINLQ
jgi:hypothetical protein